MTPEEKIEALREWANTPSNHVCKQAQRQVRDIIDPPRAKWREMVDLAVPYLTRVDPLVVVLESLANVANPRKVTEANLARIVAICEQEVGDGWRANPDRVPVGHWGISWLLVTLSHEPPAWHVLGDRAAAWLRSLTDGGAA